MAPNPDFKGTPLFDVEHLKMVQDRNMVTAEILIELTPYLMVYFQMTLSDLDWHQDLQRGTASPRQRSFL